MCYWIVYLISLNFMIGRFKLNCNGQPWTVTHKLGLYSRFYGIYTKSLDSSSYWFNSFRCMYNSGCQGYFLKPHNKITGANQKSWFALVNTFIPQRHSVAAQFKRSALYHAIIFEKQFFRFQSIMKMTTILFS